MTWPDLRDILSRIIELALGLLVTWLVIDQLLTLPGILKPEIVFVGVLALLRVLLTLLDGIWQRLNRAATSTRWKITLLTLPIAIGAVAMAGFASLPRTEPLYASMIVSGVAIVGCIAAGLIMLAIRIRISN